MLSNELRAKIAKRSTQKGGEGERGAAKLIASHFGLPWDRVFLRTKRTTGGSQVHGDILPINELYGIWSNSGFGSIEVKNRTEWTFDQIFKNPNTNKLAEYWYKSKEDTSSGNTVVIFTKPGVSYYILHLDDMFGYSSPFIHFKTKGDSFVVVRLVDFLKERWPEPVNLIK